MKNTLLFGILIITLVSCEQSKKYEYVELGTKESIFGGTERDEKDGVTIRAKTDSIAYLEAYQKFCISEKVSKDMEEVMAVLQQNRLISNYWMSKEIILL